MRIHLVCWLVLLTASVAMGQRAPNDYMAVGSFKLTLGMPEDAVLAGIAKENVEIKNLVPDKGDGSSDWTISRPSSGEIALKFKEKKLSAVSEDVGPSDQSVGVAFAGALWGALKDFESEGRTHCTIQTASSSSAGPKGSSASMSAWISCGAKSLEIIIVSADSEDAKFKVATLDVEMGNLYQ